MKHIPNIITCLNLFAGCMACVMAMQGNYMGAFIFIVMAAVFDFLDGFAARLLKAYSDIGKELDSLADVISFGLAPGMMAYTILKQVTTGVQFHESLPLIAFLLPIFAAVRLAKFNIDTRQTTSFLGLPVPANGLFWGALIPSIHPSIGNVDINSSIMILGFFAILIIVFCLLMTSELPMFSLKFKSFGWKGNEMQYILILSTIVLVSIFHLLGVSLSICLYLLMSIYNNVRNR